MEDEIENVKRTLREKLVTLSQQELRELSRDCEKSEFVSQHGFCGRCGTKMESRGDSFACPSCKNISFPKISPCIIVLVKRGEEILLQRNSHYKSANWSLVAGYVDMGENLEDAIKRECYEEASITVTNIRYFGSQTWPFPSNIMIGFTAEHSSGILHPDGEEVIESGWFSRDNLPLIPKKGSIARSLIDAWLSNQI